MPIPMVAPTIIRFSMQHVQNNGRTADNIIDVSLDESGVTRHDAVNTAVPIIVGQYQDDIAAHFWTALHFTGARWLDIDSLGGTGGFQAPLGSKPVTGGSSGTMGGPQVAAIVHKHCLHTRKQRDGRLFVPALSEADYDDTGMLTTAVLNAWHDRFSQLLLHLNSGDVSEIGSTAWRVVHVEGHTEPSPGHPAGQPNAWSSSDILTVSVDPRVATQRRRNRG